MHLIQFLNCIKMYLLNYYLSFIMVMIYLFILLLFIFGWILFSFCSSPLIFFCHFQFFYLSVSFYLLLFPPPNFYLMLFHGYNGRRWRRRRRSSLPLIVENGRLVFMRHLKGKNDCWGSSDEDINKN